MIRLRAWLAQLSIADRIVVGLAALLLVLVALSRGRESTAGIEARSFDLGAVALLAAAAALLLASKRFPGTVVLAVTVLTTVWYTAGYTHAIINLAPLVAFYQLGATGDRKRQLGFGGLALSSILTGVLAFSDEPVSQAANAVGWPVAAMVFGELIRNRRLLIEKYAERAATAEAETEQRVAEERLRIARELHDVIAHTVSVMTVQAGVAADALDDPPDEVREALATVRSAAREANRELRVLVGLLRRPDHTSDLTPAPRLSDIAELVRNTENAGVSMELTESGSRRALPALVELTAYRVVQEALTNVVRHAQASSARVRLDFRDTEMLVEIVDDGSTRPSANGTGFGLRGMAERVRSLGGTIGYGPRQPHGFGVSARLPLDRRAP